MASGTRDRIVGSTGDLFRRQGYAGTGMKQIVAEAGAPFGSLYHFFPGGKEELGEEVIRSSGAAYGELVGLFFGPEPDVVAATRAFFAGAGATLRETGYADACPIATVALEVASTNERLRRATADVFTGWVDELAPHLVAAGLDQPTARSLSTTLIALLEGAFMLSRARRSTDPMDAAGEAAALLVRAALPPPRPPRPRRRARR